MKDLKALLQWRPESDEVRAALFVRLLHYFHKHPASQDTIRLGEATTAILSLLYHDTPLSFDERHQCSRSAHGTNHWQYRRYQVQYCVNCSTIYSHNSPSLFTKECQHCKAVPDSIFYVNSIPDAREAKLFNPCVTSIDYLPEELVTLIYKRLVDIGAHPC